jgi:hypothetical protein
MRLFSRMEGFFVGGRGRPSPYMDETGKHKHEKTEDHVGDEGIEDSLPVETQELGDIPRGCGSWSLHYW